MKQKFDVTGMTCSACVAHVEKAVKKPPGVQDVAVSLMTNSMQVEYDDSALNSGAISAAVSAAVAVAAAKAAVIAALTLAVSEFLVIYNNICCIDLLAILIYIASGLDSSGNQYTHALTEIFLRKFTGTIKSYDVDKIGRLTLIAVLASSASSVNCKRISCDCHGALALGIAYFRISG